MSKDQDLTSLLSSWGAPAWAQISETDEQLIHHGRKVGEILSEATGEVTAVEVSQFDELTVEGGAAAIHRHPVRLRVGESRLGVDEAHALVEMMNSAFKVLEDSGLSLRSV